MRKAPVTGEDSAGARLRGIPSVDRILSTPAFVKLASEFGREGVKTALSAHLLAIRAAGSAYDESVAAWAVTTDVTFRNSSSLRRVVNGTGVIIHTNLGRSPIDPALWQESGGPVTGYSNLEFDLETGERGRRDEHLATLCQSLFGCEAALLTNNNAAATLLLLAATAGRKEVVVSRGELVEIGGSFRIPEVIEQGGAKLHEVGTTNRTRAADYDGAISRKTAAMLRVHRSNFDLVGFTETPSIEELVAVSRKRKVPLFYDEGTGRIVDLGAYGFAPGETIRELIGLGVDAVTCSTDKLIGATQGGLILGRADIIDRCRRHPLMRALRGGKESYAIVAATLRAFATSRHEQLIPVYRMLSTPLEELRGRAAQLTTGTSLDIIESSAALGGGTTPAETIPSVAVAIPGNPAEVHARLLALPVPIVGRIHDGRFTLDLRTILAEDLPLVRASL